MFLLQGLTGEQRMIQDLSRPNARVAAPAQPQRSAEESVDGLLDEVNCAICKDKRKNVLFFLPDCHAIQNLFS